MHKKAILYTHFTVAKRLKENEIGIGQFYIILDERLHFITYVMDGLPMTSLK